MLMGANTHPFRALVASTRNLGEVSRPEALAYAGQDVPVQDASAEAAEAPLQVAAVKQPAKVASTSARRMAIPTLVLPSPTATSALNENRRPPLTTLATRLMAMTFST